MIIAFRWTEGMKAVVGGVSLAASSFLQYRSNTFHRDSHAQNEQEIDGLHLRPQLDAPLASVVGLPLACKSYSTQLQHSSQVLNNSTDSPNLLDDVCEFVPDAQRREIAATHVKLPPLLSCV